MAKAAENSEAAEKEDQPNPKSPAKSVKEEKAPGKVAKAPEKGSKNPQPNQKQRPKPQQLYRRNLLPGRMLMPKQRLQQQRLKLRAKLRQKLRLDPKV